MYDIGIDIEEINRFVKYNKDDYFVINYFSKEEIEYCYSQSKPYMHLAGKFCAKEAFIKSISSEDFHKLDFKDIKVINDKNGKPQIVCDKLPQYSFKVSISHSKDTATAIVMSIRE